jgi:hypothetical protein
MLELQRYQWKRRPLLICAPSPKHPDYQAQERFMTGQADKIVDRDMVIGHLFQKGPSHMGGKPLSEETVESLYGALQVSREDFYLVLVGKDGTVKLRLNEPTEMTKIYEVIDAMPMRQKEMRQKDQGEE